jgi:hypothetical protein
MSTSSVDNDSGADEEAINGDASHEIDGASRPEGMETGTQGRGGRIVELLQEELEQLPTPLPLGNGTNIYKEARNLENLSEDGSVDALPKRAGSPIDSLLSIPDDTPSIQVLLPALLLCFC